MRIIFVLIVTVVVPQLLTVVVVVDVVVERLTSVDLENCAGMPDDLQNTRQHYIYVDIYSSGHKDNLLAD
jgi:hypothetical protein